MHGVAPQLSPILRPKQRAEILASAISPHEKGVGREVVDRASSWYGRGALSGRKAEVTRRPPRGSGSGSTGYSLSSGALTQSSQEQCDAVFGERRKGLHHALLFFLCRPLMSGRGMGPPVVRRPVTGKTIFD
ncbi:hypothetical protein MRX96_039060 [Rhipicephalus microplus]